MNDVRILDTSERVASAAEGLIAFAREARSAILPHDAAIAMVAQRAGPNEAYWRSHEHIPGHLVGMIPNVPLFDSVTGDVDHGVRENLRRQNAIALSLHDALVADGVIAWRNPIDDGFIRIVDQRRITAHASIRTWVDQSNAPTGKRCRCCSILEPPSSMLLFSADPEMRGIPAVVNGVPVHSGGYVQVHAHCLAQWLSWVEIATSYASQADAEAADIAAGRAHLPAKARKRA